MPNKEDRSYRDDGNKSDREAQQFREEQRQRELNAAAEKAAREIAERQRREQGDK